LRPITLEDPARLSSLHSPKNRLELYNIGLANSYMADLPAKSPRQWSWAFKNINFYLIKNLLVIISKFKINKKLILSHERLNQLFYYY